MFPMLILGKIGQMSHSEEVYAEAGAVKVRSLYTISFQPDRRTMIELEDGTHISEYLIELSLFEDYKSGKQLDSELAEDEIGFLSNGQDEAGNTHLFGAVCWPGSAASILALRGAKDAMAKIYVKNVETIPEYAPPHRWLRNRLGVLRIGSVSLSARG